MYPSKLIQSPSLQTSENSLQCQYVEYCGVSAAIAQRASGEKFAVHGICPHKHLPVRFERVPGGFRCPEDQWVFYDDGSTVTDHGKSVKVRLRLLELVPGTEQIVVNEAEIEWIARELQLQVRLKERKRAKRALKQGLLLSAVRMWWMAWRHK